VPETPETADDIRTIRYDIDAIKSSQQLLLRGQSGELVKFFLAEFKKDKKLALVYLALDGKRNQDEVADYINAAGKKVSQPTVSRKIKLLEAEGLVEQRAVPGGVAWAKNAVAEKVLRLSSKIEKQQGGI
jgi:DNA-binding transcriptional ArsR family regulator